MANLISQHPVSLIKKKILKESLSGDLIIKTRHYEKKIFFNNGKISFATTTKFEERMVQILLQTGIIQNDLLMELEKEKTSGNPGKVGEILRGISNITQDDINQAVLFQTRMIAVNSFLLKEGSWTFNSRNPAIPNTFQFNLDLSGIIREGIFKQSDLNFFISKFQNCYPVPISLQDCFSGKLSLEDRNILQVLAENSEDQIYTIVNKIFPDKNNGWKKIITLYLLNLLFFSISNPFEERLSRSREQIEDLFSKIESNSIDYYQLLNVQRMSNRDLIKQKYLELIGEYHPDKLSTIISSGFAEKVERVVAELNTAYAVLQDKKRRAEYDLKGRNLNEQVKDNVSVKEIARKLYKKAISFYKVKNFKESLFLIERVVSMDGLRGEYFLLLGMNQAKIPTKTKMAEESFLKAIKLDPMDPAPLFEMGEMFLKEGLKIKSKFYFDKVLELDPKHSGVKDSLKKLKGKTVKKKS